MRHIGREWGGEIAQRGQSLISTIALFITSLTHTASLILVISAYGVHLSNFSLFVFPWKAGAWSRVELRAGTKLTIYTPLENADTSWGVADDFWWIFVA